MGPSPPVRQSFEIGHNKLVAKPARGSEHRYSHRHRFLVHPIRRNRTIDLLTAGSAVSGAGTRPATWSTNFLPASGSLIASHVSNCGSSSKPRCPRHPQGLRKHRSFDEACYTFARILREPSTSFRQAMCPVSLRPGGRAPLCGWRVPRVLRPSVSPRPT